MFIDTAYLYDNEDVVGKAVRDSYIERQKLFITTKLPSNIKSYKGAKEYCEKSLKTLNMNYLDLYLIHALAVVGSRKAWKAMILD